MNADEEKAAIHRAVVRANPDENGSLMRELRREGVDQIIQEKLRNFVPRPSRRSNYVAGWTVPLSQGAAE